MSLVVNGLLWGANVSAIMLNGVMKIPQIYTLANSKSSVGISLSSLLLEFTGYSIMMSYFIQAKYPLEAFLEYPLLVVQDIMVLLLVLSFKNKLGYAFLAPSGIYFSLIAGMSMGYFPTYMISCLVNICIPLSASSKIVQCYAILSTKDSKGVSILTWSISAYTSIARLFTVYIETFDIPLMINFSVAFFLNMSIVCAALVYAPIENPGKKKKKE